MQELSPQQIKKLEKLAKVIDGGNIALLDEVNALDERVSAVEAQVPELRSARDGEDGHTPTENELLSLIKPLIPKVENGKNYVLKEKDKKDIAKSIEVPIVEKVIEKRETIIREVPVVTEKIIEKTVEVATLDEATIAYLEDKIDSVKKESTTSFIGGVGAIKGITAGTGVTVDNSNIQYPVVSAAGATNTWMYYVTTWSSEPTFVETITGGDVYSYTLNGTTRYRFVPSTYDATQDAFYTTFSTPTLSGLIVARG